MSDSITLDGRTIVLTRECRLILERLAMQAPYPVHRQVLARYLRSMGYPALIGTSCTMTTAMTSIRRALEAAGLGRTIRWEIGRGYALVERLQSGAPRS